MKKLLTILILFICLHAKSQWALNSIDTVKAVFKVSSLRYEHANIIAKKGYIVVLTIVYTGDKMPCATDDSDCDYNDKHKTIAYLDLKKQIIDEDKWHVWEVEKQ